MDLSQFEFLSCHNLSFEFLIKFFFDEQIVIFLNKKVVNEKVIKKKFFKKRKKNSSEIPRFEMDLFVTKKSLVG